MTGTCQHVITRAVSVCVLVLIQGGVAAAGASSPCAFPPGLHEEVSKKYPGTALVTLADLSEHDRNLYQKDHGIRCPGLVKASFYGDGKPTWALVLTAREGAKRRTELVVARRVGEGWEIRSLDTAEASAPVVWSEGPGKYDDVYGKKTVRARWPVVVFCAYESWAILYAWTGKRVEKIWIAD